MENLGKTILNLSANFNNMKNSKNTNYQKEEYRGTLKQIMKVRGLRTISLCNYDNWRGAQPQPENGIHSLKLDLQSGYLNIYGYRTAAKSGRLMCSPDAIENASAETYRNVYNQVMSLLNDEANIPSKIRKNILVRMAR